jgi:hypothetical protein
LRKRRHHCPRLACHRIQQPLPRPSRRLRPHGRKRQQRAIAAQLLQLQAANGATGQMLFQRNALLSLQRSQRVEREILSELFVPAH